MSTTLRGSRTIILALVGAIVVACSSSSSSGTGGGTGTGTGTDPAVTSADCTSSCQTKATSCGAPASSAQSQCASICAGSVTESQLTCLKAEACTALATVKDSASLNTACPPGGSGGGSDAGGGGSCKAIRAACGMADCCTDPKCACPDGTKSTFGICFNGICGGCSNFCVNHDGATKANPAGDCPKLNKGDPCGDARADGCFSCSSGSCSGAPEKCD